MFPLLLHDCAQIVPRLIQGEFVAEFILYSVISLPDLYPRAAKRNTGLGLRLCFALIGDCSFTHGKGNRIYGSLLLLLLLCLGDSGLLESCVVKKQVFLTKLIGEMGELLRCIS